MNVRNPESSPLGPAPSSLDPSGETPAGTEAEKKPRRKHRRWRETIESIVIAFILAFLFRAFEAEAFVIPTGSMAPTLMGMHLDLTCPECGYGFTVGHSGDDNGAARLPPRTCRCPNCGYPVPTEGEPWYNGDRILVVKFPYDLHDPQRWDVAVFRYPQEPMTNYIKRIVGLPNEEVQISGGDVYVRPAGSGEPFAIARKPPDKQLAMAMLVYDNDYQSTTLRQAGWPSRWQGEGWQERYDADEHGYVFELPGDGAPDEQGLHWLRYHHIIPGRSDWSRIEDGEPFGRPQTSYILDAYAYNARDGERGRNWVGDLILSFELELDQDAGLVAGELVEGSRAYQFRLDPAGGRVTFWQIDLRTVGDQRQMVGEHLLGQAETAVEAPGEYHISFSNVDDSLAFWVDGDPVAITAEAGGTSVVLPYEAQEAAAPTVADHRPAALAASRGARIGHVLLERDVYYVSVGFNLERGRANQGMDDADSGTVYVLGPDEFLALGDNSPKSKDSRLWDMEGGDRHRPLDADSDGRLSRQEAALEPTGRLAARFDEIDANSDGFVDGEEFFTRFHPYAVHRDQLIGRAFFIFWPHGVPFSWSWEIREGLRIPFYPQFDRMHRIR